MSFSKFLEEFSPILVILWQGEISTPCGEDVLDPAMKLLVLGC
jgi:hypothetical protein